jgi:hypothetical protein
MNLAYIRGQAMKKVTIPITLFLGIFLSNLIFAADFDAAGLWDYREDSHANNCAEPNPGSRNGMAGIIQTGDSFLFVDLNEGFSTFGSISSARYNFSDKFCEDPGVTTTNVAFTLSSATKAAGPVNWTYTEDQFSCSGSSQLDLTKRPQNNPIYDASGKWNYTQSGFSETCVPSSTPPSSSGYFQVTQTGPSVTAIDDQGNSYSGFIDGTTYSLVRTTFPIGGGRTTQVYLVTLGSATSGSGSAEFVWDDDCEDCWGQWTIVVSKEPAAKQKSLPGIPLLLLDD